MSLTQFCDLLEARWQPFELAGSPKTLDRAKLLVRRATRANEVRMIGIREPICSGARRSHHRTLLEDEHRPAGAGEREDAGDRLHSLCIRDGMPSAVENGEVDFLLPGYADEEVRALRPGSADLEVRRAWTAERAAAEEGAAEIRAPATGTGDDASRWMCERSQTGAEHPAFVQHLESVFVSGDVKLVARRVVKRASPVRPDLGGDTERTQKAERATGNR